MALEDVVQGVQVSVKSDGVDDAKGKIGELDKAIGSLSKTAEDASGSRGGGGGGRGAGVGGLTQAFSDLNMVGAQAFSTIARSATSGDLTGLATLMGGPVAGSFAEAGKTITQFIDTQDAAIVKNAAMAREFGTTPAAMQGIKEGFEGAGVSATGFERLVNRMSRQVTNDYADMTRNIRTDSDTHESAVLRLQAAQEKLQISRGVDPASFAAQDKLREQRLAAIAVDQAQEGVRQQALKSIPHVTELLQESARVGQQNSDITEVSTKTLRESIENMARVGEGPASPIDVLKKEAELIKSGAIDIDTAIKLLKDQGGMSRAAGLGGMDAVHEAEYFKKYGSSGIEAAQSGKSAIAQAGLGQTADDTKKATETITEWSKFTGLFGSMLQKIGASMSGNDSVLDTTLKGGEGMIKSLSEWHRRLQAAADAATDPDKAKGDRTGLGGIIDRAKRWGAAFDKPPEIPQEKLDPKTGKPVSPQPTRENIGSGPAQIIHIPEGWTGAPAPTKVKEENIGSGPGKMIHLPENYGEPAPEKPGQPKQPTSVPLGDLPEHMSVTDSPAVQRRNAIAAGRVSPATEPYTQPPLYSTRGRDSQHPGGGVPDMPVTPPLYSSRGVDSQHPAAAPAAPAAAPAITVNPATPTINVNVTAPVSVSVSAAGGATATPGSATATVSGKWQGGYIPGFADGGRVSTNFSSIPGFADGGSIGVPGEGATEKYLWEKVKQSPKAIVDTLKELGPEEGKKWLLEKGVTYGVKGLLAAAGVTPQGRAIELGAAALANVVAPVTVGAADYNAGARDTEASARSMGASNLKEMDELHAQQQAGMWGGGIPGFAAGSVRGAGNGTSDSILAHLSNGEFVMKDAAVRTYGEGFMHAVNNMQIPPPKYAQGGMVPSSSLPRLAEGGVGMERPGSILNLHVGDEVFSGLKAPASVADQLRKFAINQQTSQTGKKPSWAGG